LSILSDNNASWLLWKNTCSGEARRSKGKESPFAAHFIKYLAGTMPSALKSAAHFLFACNFLIKRILVNTIGFCSLFASARIMFSLFVCLPPLLKLYFPCCSLASFALVSRSLIKYFPLICGGFAFELD